MSAGTGSDQPIFVRCFFAARQWRHFGTTSRFQLSAAVLYWSKDGLHQQHSDRLLLDIAFTSAASQISFTFDNYGDNGSIFGQPSFYRAFDAAHNLISQGNINTVQNFGLVTVSGTGITDLQIDDNRAGWIFAVQKVNFTAAVPEPSTWAMMIVGFAGLGFIASRRKQNEPTLRGLK